MAMANNTRPNEPSRLDSLFRTKLHSLGQTAEERRELAKSSKDPKELIALSLDSNIQTIREVAMNANTPPVAISLIATRIIRTSDRTKWLGVGQAVLQRDDCKPDVKEKVQRAISRPKFSIYGLFLRAANEV
jgi:hypothetical protein